MWIPALPSIPATLYITKLNCMLVSHISCSVMKRISFKVLYLLNVLWRIKADTNGITAFWAPYVSSGGCKWTFSPSAQGEPLPRKPECSDKITRSGQYCCSLRLTHSSWQCQIPGYKAKLSKENFLPFCLFPILRKSAIFLLRIVW